MCVIFTSHITYAYFALQENRMGFGYNHENADS